MAALIIQEKPKSTSQLSSVIKVDPDAISLFCMPVF